MGGWVGGRGAAANECSKCPYCSVRVWERVWRFYCKMLSFLSLSLSSTHPPTYSYRQLTCARCYGQQTIAYKTPSGGVEEHPCPSCLGVGTVVCINCKGDGLAIPVMLDKKVGRWVGGWVGGGGGRGMGGYMLHSFIHPPTYL